MFTKIHGLRLTQTSWIENLRVETLAVDPVLTAAGKIWHNSVTGELMYSIEDPDASGTFIAKRIYDSASADAAAAAAQIVIDDLTTALADEVAARDEADNVLALAVNTEQIARTTALAVLYNAVSNDIASEATSRTAAIAVSAATASDLVASEAATRAEHDNAHAAGIESLQQELNRTQAATGTDVWGEYIVPVGSNFIDSSTSIANAVSLLDTALQTEVTDRAAATAANASAIDAEAQSRIDGDTALAAQIQAYIDSAVTGVADAEAAETIARIAADADLQAEIDLSQASIGLDAAGAFVTPTGTAYLNESTTVMNAVEILDIHLSGVSDAITAEVTARAAAVTSVSDALQTELTARAAADAAVQTELDATQAGAGLETDGSYASPTGSNYLNASNSLKDADYILDAALKSVADAVAAMSTTDGAEVTRATAAEAALQVSIDAVASAVDNFRAAVNADRFTFLADVAATSFVIAHGLASDFIQVTIMVKGDDGVFRNDIVPFEETTNNSITVGLAESRIIKVAIQRLDQVA